MDLRPRSPRPHPVRPLACATALAGILLSAGCAPAPEDSAPAAAAPDVPNVVRYPGGEGPGAGKRIVMIAGDHEYRSEEILPALGRILALRFGFDVDVVFTLDDDGFIEPGSSNIAGLETLDGADLLVIAIRFQDFPEAEMRHVVDYLDRAGPVVGLRTSTHAFAIETGPFARFSWDYAGEDYPDGFGEQVLGETWVGHYGTNHEQSSRVLPTDAAGAHPTFRGVRDIHVVSGGYQAFPPDDATVLAVGEVLNGMTRDAPADATKERMPVVWTRGYRGSGGTTGRVFTTTHGASQDFLDEGFRRLLVNAALWATGLETAIDAGADVSFVGPYHPVDFSFDGYRRGVRPSDLAGWDTPIMSPDRPTTDRR